MFWSAVSGPLTEGTHDYQFVEFLVKVLSDSRATKSFFADQCMSETVSGGLASIYTGVQRLKPGAASVNACRDKKNAAEDLLGCAPPRLLAPHNPTMQLHTCMYLS